MKKKSYKVIALSVGGKNNKVFKSGDIVDGSKFSADANDLVEKGFLEPVEDDVVEDDVVEDDVVEDDVVEDEPTIDESEKVAAATADSDDYTKNHIEQALKDLEVEYDSRDKKAVLWKVLFGSKHDASEIVELLENIKKA